MNKSVLPQINYARARKFRVSVLYSKPHRRPKFSIQVKQGKVSTQDVYQKTLKFMHQSFSSRTFTQNTIIENAKLSLAHKIGRNRAQLIEHIKFRLATVFT